MESSEVMAKGFALEWVCRLLYPSMKLLLKLLLLLLMLWLLFGL